MSDELERGKRAATGRWVCIVSELQMSNRALVGF